MATNLGDLLKDVPKLDTGREQIEYIRLDLIDEDPNNFYQLTDIDELAANIELCGLQQPIRLRPNPENPERYMIVSGHRRRAALLLLAKDDPERWREVSCIVSRDTVSPALQQLQLIFANSNTRTMTNAEISEQAVQVEKLLYQLKEEEGCEFPGRMRDHVAKVVGASKSKLARLKVIRENLAKCFQPAFKKNELVESVAYELAQMSAEDQKILFDALKAANRSTRWFDAADIKAYRERFAAIESLKCKKRGRECSCQNIVPKKAVAGSTQRWVSFHCGKCCSSCPDLISCKSACPVMADKVAKLKAARKDEQRQVREAQEQKDRPVVEKISALWQRFGLARELAYKDFDDCKRAMGIGYYFLGTDDVMKLECGEKKVTPQTKLPYNYSCYLDDVDRLVKLADFLGCSIDYLLCRTDIREMAQEVSVVSNSGTGSDPAADNPPCAWFPGSVEPPVGKEMVTLSYRNFAEDCKYLGDGRYLGLIDEQEPIRAWSLIHTDKDLENAPAVASCSQEFWRAGTPEAYGTYVAYVEIAGASKKALRELLWDGEQWYLFGKPIDAEVKVCCWAERPEV